jgi:hypothetical protein
LKNDRTTLGFEGVKSRVLGFAPERVVVFCNEEGLILPHALQGIFKLVWRGLRRAKTKPSISTRKHI